MAMTAREGKLQALCRKYLQSLIGLAERHNLRDWVARIIDENKQGRCKATEEEVRSLARLCDDERVQRKDIPRLLGKSYRYCYEKDFFSHIKMLKNNGSYSKVDALLYDDEETQDDCEIAQNKIKKG